MNIKQYGAGNEPAGGVAAKMEKSPEINKRSGPLNGLEGMDKTR